MGASKIFSSGDARAPSRLLQLRLAAHGPPGRFAARPWPGWAARSRPLTEQGRPPGVGPSGGFSSWATTKRRTAHRRRLRGGFGRRAPRLHIVDDPGDITPRATDRRLPYWCNFHL